MCTPPCSNSQPCPTGYECDPLEEGATDHLRVCLPIVEDSGCNTTGSASPSLLLLALVFITERAARPRRAAPSS